MLAVDSPYIALTPIRNSNQKTYLYYTVPTDRLKDSGAIKYGGAEAPVSE